MAQISFKSKELPECAQISENWGSQYKVGVTRKATWLGVVVPCMRFRIQIPMYTTLIFDHHSVPVMPTMGGLWWDT